MMPIRMGMIMYGHWGPVITLNFSDLPASELIAIAELQEERLNLDHESYPQVVTAKDLQELFSPGLDAYGISDLS